MDQRGRGICTAGLAALLVLGGCSSDETARAGTDGGVHDSGRPPPRPQPEASTPQKEASTPPIGVPEAGTDASTDGGPEGGAEAGPKAETLAETGLYVPGGETLAPGVVEYQVRFQLWSDGATKRRFLYLPPGKTIDTSNMDGWVFPVGTKVWKEFTRDGKRVETRLLEKTSDVPLDGWKRVGYAWNAAQTEAVAVPDGALGALGTDHDIPTSVDCDGCHVGSRDFLLGVSAIQLAHDGPGTTLKSLMDSGVLSAPPASSSLPLPGSAVAQAALGVLHANCGMCHRPGTFAYERTQMDLHLTVATLGTVQGTTLYTTAVGVPTEKSFENAVNRIEPGDATHSAVYQRMTSRAPLVAMPPFATKLVDTDGSKAVSDWIISLEP